MYCIEGPGEFWSQSVEMRLAVSGGQPIFNLALPVFAVGPKYQHRFFLLCQKHHLTATNKIVKQFHVGLKIWWGVSDKYRLIWKRLSFEFFLSCRFDVLLGVIYANIQWPKGAPHLHRTLWYGGQEAHWSYLLYASWISASVIVSSDYDDIPIQYLM